VQGASVDLISRVYLLNTTASGLLPCVVLPYTAWARRSWMPHNWRKTYWSCPLASSTGCEATAGGGPNMERASAESTGPGDLPRPDLPHSLFLASSVHPPHCPCFLRLQVIDSGDGQLHPTRDAEVKIHHASVTKGEAGIRREVLGLGGPCRPVHATKPLIRCAPVAPCAALALIASVGSAARTFVAACSKTRGRPTGRRI
jgi:hypothetical protein